MEARKITIVQTKNQKKSVIMTNATTLRELKEALDTEGIDYSDMTFYEGLSKTELKTDDSILPHDIERNGTITNELVFMLTNTEKKIKSGAMTRSDMYNIIKNKGLQKKCMEKYGRHFTNCNTASLLSLIEEEDTTCKNCDNKLEAAILELVDILVSENIISHKDKQTVLNVLEKTFLEKEEIESSYSDEEIDQMFEDMV